jgi:SET domain-containing protein
LAPSRVHGLGVFAAAPIAKGMPVWQFTPGFDLDLDPAMLDGLALEPHGVDVIVRDIAAGEELSVDYAFVDGTRC